MNIQIYLNIPAIYLKGFSTTFEYSPTSSVDFSTNLNCYFLQSCRSIIAEYIHE